MPFQLTKQPEPQTLPLLHLDAGGETTVTIRPATGTDELSLQEVTQASDYFYDIPDVGKVRERRPAPAYLVNMRKAFLVMTDCNILNEKGQPLFVQGMTWDSFCAAWGILPPEARAEIVARIGEVNPHWANFWSGVVG